VSQPSNLLPCPAEDITFTAPADSIRIATGSGQAIIGVICDGVLRWADTVVPAPLKLIDDLEAVAYHRMWSGVLEVELPTTRPLCAWLCDGELQVLRLSLDEQGHPQLILT
jgi:hypothetical protein